MIFKILLTFLSLFPLIYLSATLPPNTKICLGRLCDLNCQNCNTFCPATCQISSNCRCPSTDIPNNLPLSETPQFFFFTVDDSINKDYYPAIDYYKNIFSGIADSHGCTIEPTFYSTADYTEYHYIHQFAQTGDIGLHSTTHSTSLTTSAEDWKNELELDELFLKTHAKISSIPGSRAPFLAVNSNYLSQLKTMGKFDSSVPHGLASNGKRYWPYTLDYGFAAPVYCPSGDCINSVYEGLWEVPMQDIVDSNGYTVITMDPTGTSVDMNLYKENFKKNYEGNRAPFGFYVHHQWLAKDPNLIKFTQDFIKWVVQNYPKVIFTTERKVIEWIKNPVAYAQTVSLPLFKTCTNNQATTCSDSKHCIGWKTLHGKKDFSVCSAEGCPLRYPTYSHNNCGDSHCDLLHEDCKCSDCPACAKEKFPVATNFTDFFSSSCSSLSFSTSETAITKSFISTIELCESAQITSIWGDAITTDNYIGYRLDSTGKKIHKWRIARMNINVAANQVKAGIGFCASVDSQFVLEKMARVGTEFWELNFGRLDNLFNVKLGCGNGVCDSGETIENCQVDCKEIDCSGSSETSINEGNGDTSSDNGNTTSESNTDFWPAKVIVGGFDTIWDGGGCGKLIVSNEKSTPATKFLISAKACNHPSIKISTLWNGDFVSDGMKTDSFSKTVKNYHTNNSPTWFYLAGLSTDSQSFGYCVEHLPGGFDLNSIRISVELHKDSSSVLSIPTKCGNLLCEVGETAENCAVDCKDLVCPKTGYWFDKVTADLGIENWGDGGCGKIVAKNKNTIQAKKYVISAKVCEYSNLKISAMWVGDMEELGIGTQSNGVRYKKYRVHSPNYWELASGETDTGSIGWCLDHPSSGFNLNEMTKLAIEFKETYTTNSSPEKCGNYICDTNEENSENCPVDCQDLICPTLSSKTSINSGNNQQGQAIIKKNDKNQSEFKGNLIIIFLIIMIVIGIVLLVLVVLIFFKKKSLEVSEMKRTTFRESTVSSHETIL